MKLLRARDGKAFGGGGKVLSVVAEEANIPAAFAIYSADDYSLVFYGTDGSLPAIGDKYNNKIVTDIYTGFDTDVYSSGSEVPWYSHRSNILKVAFDSSFSNVYPVSTAYWFYNFENCAEIQTKYLSTKSVTDMSFMFDYCTGLTSLDISKLDTSNVSNMRYMFGNCEIITALDVSNFDTHNVTNMYGMFDRCYELLSLDLSNFNTGKVTDMGFMFGYCYLLASLNVENFDTSNVTNMYGTFYNCKVLESIDVSSFNVKNVESFRSMFSECYNLTSLDLGSFDTSNAKNMNRMFGYDNLLKTIYVAPNQFYIGNVEDSATMFNQCLSIVGGNGTTYDSSKIDASMAHVDTASNPGYFTAK